MEERRQGFWNQFINRNQRLILTLVSKQWLGFGIATGLLMGKYLSDQVWVLAFGIAVGANVFQKVKGIGAK
jgi:O-antigen/teichoic acid export membrane protein